MALGVFWLGLLFLVGFRPCAAHGKPEVGIGFAEEPSDIVAVRGRSATLPCKAWASRGNGTGVAVVWVHQEQPLQPDRRREFLPDGSLLIKKVQSKGSEGGLGDQGEYRCIAHTPLGALSSRPGTLRVAGLGHEFTEAPVSLSAGEGGVARFSCRIDAAPSAQMTWSKDDNPLPPNTRKYLIAPLGSSGGVLYVLDLAPEDSGNYRCTAVNEVTKKIRVSVAGQLTVTSADSGASSGSLMLLPGVPAGDIVVPESSNATLECATTSPTPLAWFVDHSGVEKRLVNGSGSGVLLYQMSNVTSGNSGTYICRTREGVELQRIRVSVPTAPVFLERPSGQMFFAARTIRFSCWVRGDPVLTVQWLKDGVPVHINGRIKHKTGYNETLGARMSELVISSSVASDSGVYQCMVRGAARTVWAAARLSLNNSKPPPVPPTQVACEALGATQVLVTWLVPAPRPDVKAFSIHYSLTDGGEERQLVTPHSNRSSTVEKLIPYTNYTFSVRAYTDSASDFSERVFCRTGEGVPVGAPTTHLESTGPNSMRVSWETLPSNLSRGVVTEYKVQWGRRGKPFHESELVGAAVHDYTITGLTPGEEYDVRVVAATKEGWPTVSLPWSKFSMPARPGASLPGKPSLHLSPVNSTAVLAAWNLSHPASLQGFKVFLRPHSGHLHTPIVLLPSQTTYLFSDLEPRTPYEVMVLGFTGEGDGEAATLSIHTAANESSAQSESTPPLAGHAPDPPIGLEAEPISSSAIRLSWARGADVAYYTVCYNPVQTSLSVDEKSIQCLKSPENEVTVKGLAPYTVYEFKVMSHDRHNRSSGYSHVVECPTKEEVPSAVLIIHWKAVNKSAVRVTWREPAKANGLLKNYTISYTEDQSLPVSAWTSVSVPSNKYSAELGNMSSQALYALTVRAATGAGFSPIGAVVTVSVSGNRKAVVANDPMPPQADSHSDQNVGVIVGLAIGLGCIVVCTVCILCRRRCSKARCTQQTPRGAAGAQPDCASSLEMEYLSQFASSQPQHVDAKGHYPIGAVNGVRLPLAGNGRVADAGIRITDNPRYDSSVSESPILGLQSKSASDSPRRSEDSLNDSNLPLLGLGTEPDASSNSRPNDTPLCLQNTNAKSASHTIECNGFESRGALFPPIRGKARVPAPVDIFDVPDSPPSKPAQLIIDFQFV